MGKIPILYGRRQYTKIIIRDTYSIVKSRFQWEFLMNNYLYDNRLYAWIQWKESLHFQINNLMKFLRLTICVTETGRYMHTWPRGEFEVIESQRCFLVTYSSSPPCTITLLWWRRGGWGLNGPGRVSQCEQILSNGSDQELFQNPPMKKNQPRTVMLRCFVCGSGRVNWVSSQAFSQWDRTETPPLGGIWNRCPSHLSWLLSTLTSSHVTGLLSLSLREHIHSFGYDPKFTTIGEIQNIGWLVNWELSFPTQLLLHYDKPVH